MVLVFIILVVVLTEDKKDIKVILVIILIKHYLLNGFNNIHVVVDFKHLKNVLKEGEQEIIVIEGLVKKVVNMNLIVDFDFYLGI